MAGSKKAPASGLAAFLTVPDKPVDKTPPMTATGRVRTLAVVGEGQSPDPVQQSLAAALAEHCECRQPDKHFQYVAHAHPQAHRSKLLKKVEKQNFSTTVSFCPCQGRR